MKGNPHLMYASLVDTVGHDQACLLVTAKFYPDRVMRIPDDGDTDPAYNPFLEDFPRPQTVQILRPGARLWRPMVHRPRSRKLTYVCDGKG